MKEQYLNIAVGFEQLAAEYKALANEVEHDKKIETKTIETKAKTSKPKVTEKPKKVEKSTVTIEEVRAVLAEKSKDGKTAKVKALLMKYDAGKLSAVKTEDYEALMKEAEVL